jgi:ATP/maltotriose-dependent transcriptional regulator MalT
MQCGAFSHAAHEKAMIAEVTSKTRAAILSGVEEASQVKGQLEEASRGFKELQDDVRANAGQYLAVSMRKGVSSDCEQAKVRVLICA